MISLKDIMNAIYNSLHSLYPNIEGVTSERIEDINSITPGFSIELITKKDQAFSENIINTFIDLDIIYFSENNSVLEAISVEQNLIRMFSLGLKVKDRFLHTLGEVETKLVDQDLHFLIRFDYADELKPLTTDDEYNLQELDTGVGNINNPTPNEDDIIKEKEELDDGNGNKTEIEIKRENIKYMEKLTTLWKLT